MKTFLKTVVLVALIYFATRVEAAGKPPQTLPPGMGRYILVLKVVGERRDTPKTITEPDVAKLGGKVLSKHDNRRVIELPAAAAKNLRRDDNVAYLQRIWMGEPLDTWDERDGTSGSALKAHTDDVAGTDLTWNSGNFGYDPSGNIKAIGSDTYGYDTSSRLVKAVVNGTTETYGYDSFGNLTQKTITGQSSTIPAIDSTSNRISGEAYDAAGNVTTNGSRIKYVFDSAGSMAELDTQFGQARRMIYTADDERIGEMLDDELIRWKIRDFNSGQILREFQSGSSLFGEPWEWTEDYIYAGNTAVGAETEEFWGGKRHFHLDHLGSVRMITNDARLRYSRNDYYPFGTEQSSSVQEATNFGFWRSDPAKFTGHEREFYGILNVDNTDYLDYMHARFYNPNMGRFLSTDRASMKASDLLRPQRWNRYAYALNAPSIRFDPDGMRDTIYIVSAYGYSDSNISKQQLRALAKNTGKKVQIVMHATSSDVRNTAAKVDSTGTDLFVFAGHTEQNPGAKPIYLSTWQLNGWGRMTAAQLAAAFKGKPQAVMLYACTSDGIAQDVANRLHVETLGTDDDFNELEGLSNFGDVVTEYLENDRGGQVDGTTYMSILAPNGPVTLYDWLQNDPSSLFRNTGFCDASSGNCR